MGTGTRQWKALMKKNFITWYRNPGCAFFEVCCPASMMILMLVLRNIITVEPYTTDDMILATAPIFPSMTFEHCDSFDPSASCTG